MSHFFTVVLIPETTAPEAIERTVEALLAPYDESIQVAPYERSYGAETYTTTRNPQAKWDWWRIGGRWDGAARNNRRSSDMGFNFSEEHEQLEHNVLPVKQLDHKLSVIAVVTPDGKWHEQGRMGWFGIMHNPKEEEDWNEEVFQLIRKYQDCIIVGIDCHI